MKQLPKLQWLMAPAPAAASAAYNTAPAAGLHGVVAVFRSERLTWSEPAVSLDGMRWRLVLFTIVLTILAAAGWFYLNHHRLSGASVQDRVRQYGEAARARWRPHFAAAGVAYPPARITVAAMKAERRLELYAAGEDAEIRHVRSFPILGASGGGGPKLREGDRQVPEGVYGIESLNPNSRFHLSLRVDYPNATDRVRAAADGRTRLGGDIMIHGGSASVGCLALGDEAAEDLFVLAADVGLAKIKVVLAPRDLRVRESEIPGNSPEWLPELYQQIKNELVALPAPGH